MKERLSLTPITIELTGSYTAAHLATSTTINTAPEQGRKTYKDPLGPLCRILRDTHGFPPETPVHIVRGDTPAFKRDLSLSYWADHDVVDRQEASARRIKYRPFEDKKIIPSSPLELESLVSK